MSGSVFCTLSSESIRNALADEGAELTDLERAEFVLAAAPGTRAEEAAAVWKRRHEADLVVGARRIGAGVRNRLYRWGLDLAYLDYTSGLRLYRGSALRQSAADVARPLEAVVRLHRHGFKIKEIAVPSRANGPVEGLFALSRLRALRNADGSADDDDRAYRHRNKKLRKRQREIVGFLEVDVPLLDVGCGSSRLVQGIGKGIGLDVDLNKLRYLRGRAPTVVAGRLEGLPFRDESFPQVVCSDVINHLANDTGYLSELHRVLRPGGTLVVGAPGYPDDRMKTELEDAGFRIDDERRIARREMIFRAVRPR